MNRLGGLVEIRGMHLKGAVKEYANKKNNYGEQGRYGHLISEPPIICSYII